MRRLFIILSQALTLVALGLLILAMSVSIAAADDVYHSEHVDLMPVGGASLRSGFVENIHSNGPQIYALERYILNGASPNTGYQVTLLLYLFDTGCSTTPVSVPTAAVQTNASGNGTAQAVFTPADVPPTLQGTHGIRWEVSTGGIVAYETACSAATLD